MLVGLVGTHGWVQPGEPPGALCTSGSATCHFLLKKSCKPTSLAHSERVEGQCGGVSGVSPGPEDILAQQFAKEL